MKSPQYLFLIALMALANVSAKAQESSIEKFGLYVVASDIDKSRVFYQNLFQKPPYVKNDRLVGFDVAGSLYAVFSGQSAAEKLIKGNNVVPYIRVKDADREFERIKSLGARLLDKQVIQEGPIKLFRIADPDGNIVEFYSLIASTTN